MISRWRRRSSRAMVARLLGTVKNVSHLSAADLLKKTTNESEESILRILSMNGRASIPLIAKMTGISPAAAGYHVKKIEEKYGIRYLSEIYMNRLGYADSVIFGLCG